MPKIGVVFLQEHLLHLIHFRFIFKINQVSYFLIVTMAENSLIMYCIPFISGAGFEPPSNDGGGYLCVLCTCIN